MVFLRRPILALMICAAALAPLAASAKRRAHAEAASGRQGTYKGYIVIDAATGRALAEDHADEVSPPASMTKLMTFLILHDKLQTGALTLQTPVTVTAADSRIGGTQVWLKEGEVFPVEELIYAMMIQSANDAAYALARTSAGSAEAFVALMNARARELGMTHTTFRSPHGLPPRSRRIAEGDLTSPRDFAILCRYLLLHTDVLKYTSVKERWFGTTQRAQGVHMINHDHLLNHVAGVDGLKTGYTEGAGYCLSSTALRNGHRLVVVIMGAFGPPGHEKDIGTSRDRKTIELLEQGFASLPPNSPTFVAAPDATPAESPVVAAPLSPEEKKAAAAPTGPVITLPKGLSQ